jgi:hypothetical protein
MIWVAKNPQVAGIRYRFWCWNSLPSVGVPQGLVDEDWTVGPGADDDGAIPASHWSPRDIWGAKRLSAIIGHELDSRRGIEEKWIAVDAVVHRECVTGPVVWTTAILVGL